MDDFYATADRAYNDFELLYDNSRWFNACYLAGYIVECYSKILLELSGMKRRQIRGFSHELCVLHTELASIIPSLVAGGVVPAQFLCDISLVCPNIIDKWRSSRRYRDNSYWDECDAEDYKKEIESIIIMLWDMKVSGVIR